MARRPYPHDRARGIRGWWVAAGAALVVGLVWLATAEHAARGGALDPGADGRAALDPADGASLWPTPEDPITEDAAGDESARPAPQRLTTPIEEPPPEPLLCFVRVASVAGPLLADAVVRSSFGPSASDPSAERGGSQAVTNGLGDASVHRPEDGARWKLHVDAEGHFHHRATRATDDDILVRLALATELSGLTVDAETGAPIAGVEVTHVHDRCEGCDAERVRSDAEGKFVLRSVPLGIDVTLTAQVAGHGDAAVRLHLLAEDDPSACRIALRRSTKFRLAAFDALSGEPVTSAEALPSGARAQRDGEITTEGAPDGEGRVRVAVRAPGYLVSEGEVAVTRGARIAVPLLEGAHITGSVLRPDGTAVAGATVTAADDEVALAAQLVDLAARAHELPAEFAPRVDVGALSATTDGSGRFELRGLWPRSRYVLRVTQSGSVPVERRDIATNVPGRSSIVGFVLAEVPLGSWRGRALLDGAPVEAELTWSDAVGRGSARTGKDGAFVLTGLPARQVWLSASAVRRERGESRARGAETGHVPSSGELLRDVMLSVHSEPLVVTRGFVHSSLGAGLGGVEVGGGAWSDATTFTDESGAFALAAPGQPSSVTWIRASAHGYDAYKQDVLLGSDSTVLVLPRCVPTIVHVVEAGTGRALERWQMSVYVAKQRTLELGRTGDPLREAAEALGGGRVVYLPEGQVALEVTVPDFALAVRRELTVVAGEVARCTFRVPAFDFVDLSFVAEGDLPRAVHVHVVPTDRAGALGAHVRPHHRLPSFEVPVEGRLGSAREDGGWAWESVQRLRIGSRPAFPVGLRRDVDYTLIADDPRVSIAPALLPALDRAQSSRSVHTLRAAE